jgi:hypothetical protein
MPFFLLSVGFSIYFFFFEYAVPGAFFSNDTYFWVFTFNAYFYLVLAFYGIIVEALYSKKVLLLFEGTFFPMF